MERFKTQLADVLSKALEANVAANELETPPDRSMGDFAFPCFKLSKALRKAPPLIAQEIASKVAPLVNPAEFSVKSVGPYVNFSITPTHLANTVLKDILSANETNPYASITKNSRPKWVFEFSSPNVAKPFQIYHLRTTIVGSALSKIARLRGYDVTTINHLGDWGTQYGKLAIALKKYASTLPTEITIADLVRVYVQIHKDMETDDTIEKQGQELFLKLEQGDPEMTAIWQKCVDISMKEFKKVYARYQVSFDHYWGESFYQNQLKPLTDDLKKRKIMELDQGAYIVRVTSRAGGEIPPTIMEKSDGASIYATRDVAAAIYRHEKFKFERMTYVVGKEQILHFEQVFGVLRAMGFEWEKACEHLATGLYRFKDAKMSTRKGNFVTLDEVNEMCVEKALSLMNERNNAPVPEGASESRPKLTSAEITTIAEQVAVGALVFADLSTDPTKDLDFDVDRVISFEGETGPYLQYAHTRCLSILKKASAELKIDTQQIKAIDVTEVAKLCSTNEELNLIKTLGRLPSVLERTLDVRKPSQLTTYLIDVTNDFGAFYRECKVMNADNPKLTLARLSLVEATRAILGQGLELLGIPKPEKM